MCLLFSPLRLRELTIRNRVFVSPMCQYSSREGMPTDWHLVHLGSRAVGGAGLVMVEATAVSPDGRISPDDSGIWSDAHAEAFRPIAAFIRAAGAVPAIQIAHAGRKASTGAPWRGGKPLDVAHRGWEPVAPSALAFDEGHPVPHALSVAEIDGVVEDFAAAARRADAAGFEVVEIHAAHGYLLHEFLSPLANQRTDDYGGALANRMRIVLRVAEAVRAVWPQRLPLLLRISATDWAEGGWDLNQSIELARAVQPLGVDLIDCSSGGLVPHVKIPLGPGYQVPFANAIRREAGIATGAVGMITDAHQAEQILTEGKADAVLLARAMLLDPYWPLHAAEALGADVAWPDQYARAHTVFAK
ncbi:MAG TPA: NADH:flavin oxidoreductase/NADH oxidase [Phycisphaerae bacterium]|nr:NADH:flavin oxidoreductase/NADH oxidase [Phycisphaerales bacterium]HRX83727.1 NADH:flavin oxidoreductase/NADH oxidase [Phycisphaerae bacterium]